MHNNTIPNPQLVAALRNNYRILEQLVAMKMSQPDGAYEQVEHYVESMIRVSNLLHILGEQP